MRIETNIVWYIYKFTGAITSIVLVTLQIPTGILTYATGALRIFCECHKVFFSLDFFRAVEQKCKYGLIKVLSACIQISAVVFLFLRLQKNIESVVFFIGGKKHAGGNLQCYE